MWSKHTHWPSQAISDNRSWAQYYLRGGISLSLSSFAPTLALDPFCSIMFGPLATCTSSVKSTAGLMDKHLHCAEDMTDDICLDKDTIQLPQHGQQALKLAMGTKDRYIRLDCNGRTIYTTTVSTPTTAVHRNVSNIAPPDYNLDNDVDMFMVFENQPNERQEPFALGEDYGSASESGYSTPDLCWSSASSSDGHEPDEIDVSKMDVVFEEWIDVEQCEKQSIPLW